MHIARHCVNSLALASKYGATLVPCGDPLMPFFNHLFQALLTPLSGCQFSSRYLIHYRSWDIFSVAGYTHTFTLPNRNATWPLHITNIHAYRAITSTELSSSLQLKCQCIKSKAPHIFSPRANSVYISAFDRSNNRISI